MNVLALLQDRVHQALLQDQYYQSSCPQNQTSSPRVNSQVSFPQTQNSTLRVNSQVSLHQTQTSTPQVSYQVSSSVAQKTKIAPQQAKFVSSKKDHLTQSIPNGESKSIWHNQLKGDINTVEICIFSLSNKCKFEATGCRALHSKFTFQWQFENNCKWYNFPEFHSKQLEDSFQKPDTTSIKLHAIIPTKLNVRFKDLIKHLGTGSWTADFDNMVITQGQNSLNIRQVTTHSSAISNSKLATAFEWYFKDECDKWIMYGQPNSLNKGECVVNVTSTDIEINYAKNKKDTMEFCSSSFKYVIDFKKMIQTNQSTMVCRPIRRRTKPQLNNGPQFSHKGKFPSYWTTMPPEDLCMEVLLPSDSVQYKTTEKRIKQTLPSCNILSMKRIQNPHLWNAFRNAKDFYVKKTKSGAVKDEFLFHGTSRKNIRLIMEQNLDWRLHGSNVGHIYGRGTYFSNR